MASGQNSIPQVIGSVLGAAFKELIKDPPTNNTERSASGNRNRNAHQNFKKNTKPFNSHNDANSKKVVKTLEKLVDAKEEALTQEMIRRRKAEQELRELQQKLEKVQVKGDTKEQAVKKDESSRKNKPHWRSDGKGGGGRGGYTKCGRGGYNVSNRGDSQPPSHSGPSKFNNSSNIKSERGDYNKVYNKQPFDNLASVCKMNNYGELQFCPPPPPPLPPQKSMNNRTYPVASNFHQSEHFHGTGSQFPQMNQGCMPQQYHPNMYGLPNVLPQHPNFSQHGPENARGGAHNIHYRRRSENRDQKLKQKKDKVEEKAYGNQGKEAYSAQKGKKGKKQNDEETGEVSNGEDALQIFLKADIPTEEEICSKNISMNQPVKEFTLVAKDICFVPSTVGDMVSFKKKYPDAKAILVKDEDDI